MRRLLPTEWPTLAILLACYAVWALATTVVSGASLAAGIVLTALATALHGSITHEVVHGHPFRSARLNAALVFPALTLLVPYGRFRDTHLAHHRDSRLTDPYDDPESNYLDPAVWDRLSRPAKALLAFNNKLAGRLLVGPLVGQVAFMRWDWRAARAGDARVLRAWAWHIPALAPVALWLWGVAQMPLWAYAVAVYLAMAILKIRTFLEHRAHDGAPGRTVIIEDRGPLAWIFLHNNLHVVHHVHPGVPWYRLPRLYFGDRAGYLARNGGYAYRSYAQIFRQHLFRAKDPVAHPLWHRG